MKVWSVKNKTPQQKLRLAWLGLLFLLILAFLYFKIVPFGQISYTKNYDCWWQSGKGFIYNFTPLERVNEEEMRPKIIGDPVYFSVFTPRTFSQATITVVFRDNLSQETPIIEAGVLADKLVWRYDLKPLQNQILDNLMLNWQVSESAGVTFLQKNKNYDQLADFLKDLETGELKDCPRGITTCLATYNLSPNQPINLTLLTRNQLDLENYNIINNQESTGSMINNEEVAGNIINNDEFAQNTLNSFNIPLKGNHVLFVYLETGYWQLKTKLVPESADTKNNPIRLILTKDQEIIKEVFLDGSEVDWQNKNEQQLILAGDFSAGLYKLEIKISDDVIINNLSSSSGEMVFAHKFWPVNYDKEIKIFTDTNYLQIKALDPANLQNIIFADEIFSITKPYEQFEFKVKSEGIKEIKLEKDNLILENNSVFSLRAEDFFNPLIKKVDRYFTENSDLNYILANYQAPLVDPKDEQLKIASADFRLKGVYREKGKYNFMLSIPGLKTENNRGEYLEIKEIKIEFRGRSLWQKIFNISD